MQPFLILLLATTGHTPQPGQIAYIFETARYDIRMTVAFPQPYLGRRLAFYNSLDPRNELCYALHGGPSGTCVERFVGAVATVQYSVRPRNSKSPARVSIRELVTVVDQSEGLPDRPPFSKTVPLVNGIGSDVQVFGYDESEVGQVDRLRTRQEVERSVWRVYRQALYIAGEPLPFVILEWRHTISRIHLLNVHPIPAPAPPGPEP